MSRLFGLALSVCVLSFVTDLGWGADDLHSEVKGVLRLGTRADKSPKVLSEEAIQLHARLSKSGPIDPHLEFAFGLVLAKHGKHNAAVQSLTPAAEGLDGEVGLASRAILAWTLASQRKHQASLTELETLSEQLEKSVESLGTPFARDLATLCGQLVGFYEGPMAEAGPVQVARIKASLNERWPDDARAAFADGIQLVLAEFEKRKSTYTGEKQAVKTAQQQKVEERKANLEETRQQLKEEHSSLQTAAAREQQRLESAKGKLDADYRSVQDEFSAVQGTMSQLGLACQQLERDKAFCVRRYVDQNGREVVEVDQTQLAIIDSQINSNLLQINQLRTRQSMLRNRARQLEAQGAQVLDQEAATVDAVQRKQSELQKASERVQKLASKTPRTKEETTKTRALRANMQNVANYVALPFVAEGKRLLAASKP